MGIDEVMDWLAANRSEEEREKLTRYGIPDDRALGISVGDLKRFGKRVGTDHGLALELWRTGGYEARTLAAFIDDPGRVTRRQMDEASRAWIGKHAGRELTSAKVQKRFAPPPRQG